jgi:hypothetical protein
VLCTLFQANPPVAYLWGAPLTSSCGLTRTARETTSMRNRGPWHVTHRNPYASNSEAAACERSIKGRIRAHNSFAR